MNIIEILHNIYINIENTINTNKIINMIYRKLSNVAKILKL